MFLIMKMALKTNRLKKSSVDVRLSRLENKIDLLLYFIQGEKKVSAVNPDIVRDAIRAHIRGDRGPMNRLEQSYHAGIEIPLFPEEVN
jgi:hypothetical protein